MGRNVGTLEYLIVDSPHGASDIALTAPQDYVSILVNKATRRAEMLEAPVLGIAEKSMESIVCPNRGKRIRFFGDVGEEPGVVLYDDFPRHFVYRGTLKNRKLSARHRTPELA